VQRYYDRRAPEYDDWYLGLGLFAGRERAGWDEELHTLEQTIAGLPPALTLDAACGTGYLTRHLRGELTGLDQSERMIEIARKRSPEGSFVRAEALALPFREGAFERVFTAHFYGHLRILERQTFLGEAWRVADELVVVDAALRPDKEPEELQERVLSDGSRHQVYKRYFDPSDLAEELGGGRVLHAGRWFVMVAV
jgi:ubiquinone/menaquinone biosynthesis C-methylase UbiE